MKFKRVRLGDIARFINGRAYKNTEFKQSGTPIVRIQNLTGKGNVVYSDLDLPEDKYIDDGDLIYAWSATFGPYIWKGGKSIYHYHIWKVEPFQNIDKHYLYYLLRMISDQISAQGTGSIFAHITKGLMESYEVDILPYSVQRTIGRSLKSIDDKIQLNQKINQTLEQMAQAIFKSWFVDFEPVKAKIAALEAGGSDEDTLIAAMQAISGKDADQLATMQAEKPEQYAELRATAELFPSAMQESEMGEIPEGWNSGTLNEIADFPNDRISTDELTLSNYVSTENMLDNKRGIVNASSVSTSQTVPKYVAGHILVSNIRPYFKKIWLADSEGGRSPDVLGFEGKNNASPEFLYNVLYQDKFFEYMMLTSKGAKMPRGDKKAIMGFALTIPPVALSELFSTRVKSFYLLRRQYEQQIQTLECLRDTLLPKLLSGELNIGESISTAGELAYV